MYCNIILLFCYEIEFPATCNPFIHRQKRKIVLEFRRKLLSRSWIYCAVFWKIIIFIWQQHPPSLPSKFPCHPYYYPNANGNPSNKKRHPISLTHHHPSYCRYLNEQHNVELHLLRCWEVGWTTLGAGVHYNASKFLDTSVPLPLLHCNREILSSNSSRDPGLPHWEFTWFPSVSRDQWRQKT
jgi:hypothetical protein